MTGIYYMYCFFLSIYFASIINTVMQLIQFEWGPGEHSIQVLGIKMFDENVKVDHMFRGISTLRNETQGKDRITTFTFNRKFLPVLSFFFNFTVVFHWLLTWRKVFFALLLRNKKINISFFFFRVILTSGAWTVKKQTTLE